MLYQKKQRGVVRQLLAAVIVWSAGQAIVSADVTVAPSVITPDSDRIARFSIAVTNVPSPGFRSYALSVDFQGASVNLVNTIDSFSTPLPEDTVTCAAQLRLDVPSETIVQGSGMLLESGQGNFVLDSVGGGSVLAADNQIVSANTAQYNIGVAGDSLTITPQTGNGDLIKFLCYVGTQVSGGTVLTIAPGLYPGLNGAIYLDQQGSAPIDHTFTSGTVQVAGSTPSGDLNGDGSVDVRDVILAERILFGEVPLIPLHLTNGDVAPLSGGIPAPDGQFTVGDMHVILGKILGQFNF